MLARDYINRDFRTLHLLRLFLPTRSDLDEPQRWSELLSAGEQLTASADWNELWFGYLVEHPGAQLPEAPLGSLDPSTAEALREILGAHLGADHLLHTRSWVSGDRGFPPGAPTSIFDGQEYAHETLGIEEIIRRGLRDRLPQAVEDPDKAFAWGAGLYPDSLVIAAAPELFRAFHQDERLEVVSVVPHRDVLPPSFCG